MNTVVLSGRLVREPELRRTASGNSMLMFCIAVRSSTEHTNFLDCVAYEKLADLIYQNVKKGEKIVISGTLNQRTYDGTDGRKHDVVEVFVREAEFQLKLAGTDTEEVKEEPKPKTKKATKKA